MIDRFAPTAYFAAAGFILGLATACVYAAVAAWDRRRAAKRAERRARPHSARVGTATADQIAIANEQFNTAVRNATAGFAAFQAALQRDYDKEQRHG